MKSLKQHTQAGFTLIELVVVIVILGILAATALPRFFDLTSDARRAAVAGSAGAFASGVSMAHAKWLVGGTGIAGTLMAENKTVYVNGSGYPIGGADAVACGAVWTQILSVPMTDFTAAADTTTATTCIYTYSNTQEARTITYDSTNGTVVAANPVSVPVSP